MTNRGFVKTIVVIAFALMSGTAVVSAQPVTVTAQQQQGAEKLIISGNAPANQPVRVSLSAVVSKDVPTITLGTTEVWVGSNGRYTTVVSIAPNYGPGSVVTVQVSSAAGGDASTTYIVGAPNPGVRTEIEGS